ncbi:hypothetical protein [Nostoc sp.]
MQADPNSHQDPEIPQGRQSRKNVGIGKIKLMLMLNAIASLMT